MKDKKSWWSRGSGTPMMLLVCMCVIVIIGSIVAMVVWMQAHGVQVGPLHQKATEMTDYAFDLSMRHTSAEDGAVDETKLTGTVLNSAKQAEVTIGEEQPFRIVLDTDYLYLPTKDLLTTFGTTLLGDMDSNEYTESLYDEIFSSDVTRFNLKSYALPVWGEKCGWSNDLEQIAELFKSGCKAASEGVAKTKAIDGGTKVTLDAAGLKSVMDAIQSETYLPNSGAIYNFLTSAAETYATAVAQYSAPFQPELTQYMSELANAMKQDREAGIQAQNAAFAEWVQSVQDSITDDTSAEYLIYEKGNAIVQSLILKMNGEAWEITLVKSAAYKSRIVDIPEEFSEFSVMVEELKEALENTELIDIPNFPDEDATLGPDSSQGGLDEDAA